MQTYIQFPDYATAHAADLRAFAFLKNTENANGAQWSGVFTDGTRYGILFDADIAGAFSIVELQNSIAADDWIAAIPPAQTPAP